MANDKRQDEIIEEFSVFDEWLDKYEYLIGLSDTLPAIAPEHRTDQYLIQGCQSRVWIALSAIACMPSTTSLNEVEAFSAYIFPSPTS